MDLTTLIGIVTGVGCIYFGHELGDLFAPLLTDPQDLMPAIEALQRRMTDG